MQNRAVVLTVSDRSFRKEREDLSGPAIIELLADLEATLIHREILPDEALPIRDAVQRWIDRAELVLLTGGTGIAPRDVTPQAVHALIERHLPGFGEVMRGRAFQRLPTSITSRAGAGVTGTTLIIWLPGSPAAVRECIGWTAPAIRHVCKFLRGDAPH
jgi:molybdenum cofactor synthesis domain-containing protein